MTAKVTDFSGFDYANGRPHLCMQSPAPEYGYRRGLYWSRHGLVDIYWQPTIDRDGRHWDGLTAMSIITEGRCYHRSWKAAFGDKTIARLAREFADECAGEPA